MYINKTNYLWIGPASNLGRFGTVANGATLALTDDERDTIAAGQNPSYLIVAPVGVKVEKQVTTTYTALQADSGKLLRLTFASGATITLPTSPNIGTNLEFAHGPTSAATATLDPGSNAIDGTVATFALTTTVNRKGLIFGSSGWVSY